MSSEPSGLQNYGQLEDKDKAYIVKLLIIVIASILGGFITGIIYSGVSSPGPMGFGIFLASLLGSSIFIKFQFDLKNMTDLQILRHGIVVGLLVYIFIWTVIFQFFLTTN